MWTLEIGSNGDAVAPSLVHLTSTTKPDKRGNTKTVEGQSHITPVVDRTFGVSAFIPHDRLGHVLGWCDEESKPERIAASHAAYVGLIEQWANAEGANDPIARALQQFVRSDATRTIQQPDKWTSKDNVLLTVGGILAHRAVSLRTFWTRHVESVKGSGIIGECLICGRVGAVVDTLPQMVKGTLVPGGRAGGVAPISVNASAFGYGLTKGLAHVPICLACAQAVPAALNHLLSDEGRRKRTSSTATTWWIKGTTEFDPLDFLDQAKEGDIAGLIASVESAMPVAAQIDPSVFNGLVVSGNGPRMIINDWMSMPLRDLQANIARWFVDTETEPAWASESRYTPLWLLATSTGRFDSATSRYRQLGDTAGHHPDKIVESLRHAALNGSTPPHQLATWVLIRVSSDHHIDTSRAALLRLALRRTYQKGNLMPGLDTQCTDPCYVAGRLFGEYDQIQYAAATIDGGDAPNATFADRHFSGAITNPAMAIASGEKQAAAWLSRLRRNGRDALYSRALDEIVALLEPNAPIPLRATIEQQAMFVLGFHHQRAANRQARQAAAERKRTAETTTTDNDD